MKLPFLGKIFSPGDAREYLAIDLGSDVVHVAIFRLASGLQTNTQILGTGRQAHGLTSMRGGQIADFDAVLETTDLAIEEARLHAGLLPRKVIIGLSGAVIRNVGISVRIRRAQPEKQINSDEFTLLGEKIEAQTVPKAKEALERIGYLVQDLEHTGTYFTGYQIDGAKVNTPLGLSGEVLQTQVLHSFTPLSLLEQVNKLADQLNLEIVALIETAVSIASRYLEDCEAGIVVDLGGQVTEVVVFRQRKILANLAFNLGGRDFTLAIQETGGDTFAAAEKLKRGFVEGHLDAQRSQVVRASIKPVLNLWVNGLEVALRQFKQAVLPPRLILVGQDAAMDEVKSTLVAHPWNRVLPFNQFPKIDSVGNGNLALKSLTETQL